jgi:hypothetical protein
MVTSRRLGLVMLLLGLAVTAWIAPTVGVRATYFERTTADEPQYLMTAISLGEDLDLDVADERTEQRYRAFHEVDLPVQEEVQPDGSAVSPHDPLLPAALAAPMRVGGWVAAKLALALLAGLLAAMLVWVAVRRFAVPLAIAVVSVSVFAASAPFVFYGTQIYPELPAALAVTVAIAALTGRLRRRGLVVLGLAVVALPWLSVKYAPVAGALAAIGLVVLWRRGERRTAVGVMAGLAAAGAVYLLAHHALYGGWTVYASGDHFSTTGEASVMGVTPDYAGRANRLLGLLTDRSFGLAAWQPAFLLAIPALVALLRRRPRGWPVLALPLAAGWLNATFVALTMHGWWWPGRQVVVVLPCVVLAIAWWVGQYRQARPWLVVTGALGILSAAWLTVECLLGDRTLVFDFDGTTNPWYRAWQLVLPDDRLQPAGTLLLRVAWLVVAALLALWGWRSVRAAGRASPSVPPEPSVRSIEQENHECEPASVLVASR